MIIDLRTLTKGPQEFAYRLPPGWWPSNQGDVRIIGLDAPLDVRIKIAEAGSKYILEGSFSGGFRLRCDRCLVPYHRDLDSEFRVFLTLKDPGATETELEVLDEDLEVDFLQGMEVNVNDIIQEQIYLALPMKLLCAESCRGLCSHCGLNLNQKRCSCPPEQGHPGFSKLRNFRILGE
jgi:uncharacterized protein